MYLSYEYLTLDRSKSSGWPLAMSGGQVPVRFATYKQRHLLAVAPARSRDTYELTRVPPTESMDLEQTFEWYELVMFLCNVEPGLKDIARTFGSNLVPFLDFYVLSYLRLLLPVLRSVEGGIFKNDVSCVFCLFSKLFCPLSRSVKL